MDNPTLQALLSALRSLLVAAGAVLVTRGYLTDTNVNEIIGAVMIIIPVIWGIVQKFMSERATKQREVVAVHVGMTVADNTIGKTPPVAPVAVPQLIDSIGPRVSVTTPNSPAYVSAENTF